MWYIQKILLKFHFETSPKFDVFWLDHKSQVKHRYEDTRLIKTFID